METEFSNVHPAPSVNGFNGCGPVCFQSQVSVESARELEARSWSLKDLCSAFVLEKDERLCFSSLCSDKQGTDKSPQGHGNFSADHTNVANTAMVSNTTTVVPNNSITSSSVIRFIIKSERSTSSHNKEQASLGGLEGFMLKLINKGNSGQAASLI